MFAGELGSPLIGRYPFLAPAYLAAGFKIIKEANPDNKPQLEELTYAIHFRYGLKFATVYDMEFAFPVDFNDSEHGFDVFIKAIDIVVNAITDAAKPGKYKVTSKFKCDCEDKSNIHQPQHIYNSLTRFSDNEGIPSELWNFIRLIKKSKCLLCPATPQAGDTSTHTVYVEIFSFVGTETYKDFFTVNNYDNPHVFMLLVPAITI